MLSNMLFFVFGLLVVIKINMITAGTSQTTKYLITSTLIINLLLKLNEVEAYTGTNH